MNNTIKVGERWLDDSNKPTYKLKEYNGKEWETITTFTIGEN